MFRYKWVEGIGKKKIYHIHNNHIRQNRLKNVARDKRGHLIMIKGNPLGRENTWTYMSLTTQCPNMKQKLTNLKGGLDNSTIIVGDYNSPLPITSKTTRQNMKGK